MTQQNFIIDVRQGEKKEQLSAPAGANLLSLLQQAGFTLETPCGGQGRCGKCKVRLLAGPPSATTRSTVEERLLTATEKSEGYRLACLFQITGNLVLELPTTGYFQILTNPAEDLPVEPVITEQKINLPPPSLDDQRSDLERIKAELPGITIPFTLFKTISTLLRENNFKVKTACFGHELLVISGQKASPQIYGLAVDLGTTTITGYLLDLSSNKEIGAYSTLNPQRRYGADVLTRIQYCMENPAGLTEMADVVRDELNKMITYFTVTYDLAPTDIYRITVAGNTIMLHLLAALPVDNIGLSPFIPVITTETTIKAAEFNININPCGKITLLPMIAGYVGADTIAAILACGMDDHSEINLMVDIGTNGEIALGNKEAILTCAAAAGPALEGAHIQFGMGAVDGGISQVNFDREKGVSYATINNKPAVGLCGSGIIDLLAILVEIGLVDETGRLYCPDDNSENWSPEFPPSLCQRISKLNNVPAFLVASTSEGAVRDIYFTQKDIRELQLAKAAIAAGIKTLLDEMEISAQQIGHLYLAGGFGNYIDLHHAVGIGLLPKELEDKTIPIGNAAGTGAKMALLSQTCLARTETIRQKCRYIELSANPSFNSLFIEEINFPATIF